jgi:hypothetical protein
LLQFHKAGGTGRGPTARLSGEKLSVLSITR